MSQTPEGTTLEEFYRVASPKDATAVKSVAELLRGLGKKESRLCSIINSAADAVKSGRGYFSSDGISITPCDDGEDFRIAIAPERRELNKVRQQIATALESLFQKGFGYLGIVKRHYTHYVGKPLPALETAGR